MTRPFSNDLRERLISAVEGGMSRRSAAKRFGIAASTAIKWVDQWRRTGDVRPRPQGGDKRSHRIEAHADEILAVVEERPDMTLAKIAEYLNEAQGLKVAQSTVWRLLDRHSITVKKPRTPASSNGLTVCGAGGPGLRHSPIWSPNAWCSSTKPAPRPRWPDVMVGRRAASAAALRCPMGIGRPLLSSGRSGLKA